MLYFGYRQIFNRVAAYVPDERLGVDRIIEIGSLFSLPQRRPLVGGYFKIPIHREYAWKGPSSGRIILR